MDWSLEVRQQLRADLLVQVLVSSPAKQKTLRMLLMLAWQLPEAMVVALHVQAIGYWISIGYSPVYSLYSCVLVIVIVIVYSCRVIVFIVIVVVGTVAVEGLGLFRVD